MAFRPSNHPLLLDDVSCPSCHANKGQIDLPAYPGDCFDCTECDESFTPSMEQVKRMLENDKTNGMLPPLSWIQE